MGTVIRFPDERVAGGERGGAGGVGATVVILPVIRIERGNDEPSGGIAPGTGAPGRKGRRRGPR